MWAAILETIFSYFTLSFLSYYLNSYRCKITTLIDKKSKYILEISSFFTIIKYVKKEKFKESLSYNNASTK